MKHGSAALIGWTLITQSNPLIQSETIAFEHIHRSISILTCVFSINKRSNVTLYLEMVFSGLGIWRYPVRIYVELSCIYLREGYVQV